MHKKILLFITAAMLPLAALFACSDNGNAPVPVFVAASETGAATPDSATPDAPSVPTDAGAECGTPAKLFTFGDGGLFCPFSSPPGNSSIYCASGSQQCCVTPQAAGTLSTCVARDAGCPVANSTPLACGHPQDCAAGQKCCATSSTMVTFNVDPACGPFLSKFGGTKCAASCQATELVVCGVDTDCPTGQTCVAVKPKGNNTGVCH